MIKLIHTTGEKMGSHAPAESNRIYRINAAAALLSVSRTTIYRMVKAGHLDLVKISVRASGITAKSIDARLQGIDRGT
jgi:excisionase family DNA binding protein